MRHTLEQFQNPTQCTNCSSETKKNVLGKKQKKKKNEYINR